jgi:hypothetical protein
MGRNQIALIVSTTIRAGFDVMNVEVLFDWSKAETTLRVALGVIQLSHCSSPFLG